MKKTHQIIVLLINQVNKTNIQIKQYLILTWLHNSRLAFTT